jgi:myo-inositol-1(or 4)-monophosphatase
VLDIDHLWDLAGHIRAQILRHGDPLARRVHRGASPGGDTQFHIDAVAEDAIAEWLNRDDTLSNVAIQTEDRPVSIHGAPSHLLLIDPIDGTRPAAAGFDQAVVAVAAAPYGSRMTIGDVTHSVVLELASGAGLCAETGVGVSARGYDRAVPHRSATTDLDKLYWAMEFNGHPAAIIASSLEGLIDRSANTGAVFVFSSASFAITRIVTGQLDAYLDIGNRVLRDHPATRSEFLRVGGGNVLHLFPYDIAAAVHIGLASGCCVSDGYGRPLDDVLLLDNTEDNLRSCVAASNPDLHGQLLEAVRW